jgi:hypothetical protein
MTHFSQIVSGFFHTIGQCCSRSSPETKSSFQQWRQGHSIQIGAGIPLPVPLPSAERVLDSHRIENLEIQVKALQDEVHRISELCLENSSNLQKTATAGKTVADDTAILAKAVKDLGVMVNKLAHTVKHLSHAHSPEIAPQAGAHRAL